jgi:hypothetical protein
MPSGFKNTKMGAFSFLFNLAVAEASSVRERSTQSKIVRFHDYYPISAFSNFE